MSAQAITTIPQRSQRVQPFLPLDHSLLESLAAICHGAGMWVLLTQVLSAANRRGKDGSFTGWTNVIRTQDMADKACLLRHALNAQIRIAIEKQLIERMDPEAALEAGLISQDEAKAELDGFVYRALVRNWQAVAELEREEWADAQAAKQDAATDPKKRENADAEWEPTNLEAGEVREIPLSAEGKRAFSSARSVTFDSDLPVQFAMRVLNGQLQLEARATGDAGKYIYRAGQATEETKVSDDLRKLVAPLCLHHCGKKADETLLKKTAANLQDCPVTGDFSYETILDRTLRDLRKKHKEITPGIFPHVAEIAGASWLERREHLEVTKVAAAESEARQSSISDRAIASALLKATGADAEMISEAERAWAQQILSKA